AAHAPLPRPWRAATGAASPRHADAAPPTVGRPEPVRHAAGPASRPGRQAGRAGQPAGGGRPTATRRSAHHHAVRGPAPGAEPPAPRPGPPAGRPTRPDARRRRPARRQPAQPHPAHRQPLPRLRPRRRRAGRGRRRPAASAAAARARLLPHHRPGEAGRVIAALRARRVHLDRPQTILLVLCLFFALVDALVLLNLLAAERERDGIAAQAVALERAIGRIQERGGAALIG